VSYRALREVADLEPARLGFKALYESGPNGTPDSLLASGGGPGDGLSDFLVVVLVSGETPCGVEEGDVPAAKRP
jgi:hypothetical protein